VTHELQKHQTLLYHLPLQIQHILFLFPLQSEKIKEIDQAQHINKLSTKNLDLNKNDSRAKCIINNKHVPFHSLLQQLEISPPS